MKTAALTEETSVAHSSVQHDSELTFAEEEGAIAKQDKIMPYNTVTKYLEGFTSDHEASPASPSGSQSGFDRDVGVSLGVSTTHMEPADSCLYHTNYLNFMDYPQTLEYSDLITHALPITHEILDAEEDGTEIAETDLGESEMHNDSSHHENKLYRDAPISTASSSVLLMKFIMKHRITQEALTDLLKVLKLHCPSPNNLPSTVYHFKKQFKDLQYPIIYHYFCSKCLAEVSTESTVCNNTFCKSTLTEPHTKSSFIEVPIDLQLKCILERKHIYSYTYNIV